MHIHSLRRVALGACALAVLVASSAAAKPVTTQLHVEAEGRDLGPGFRYVHDSVSYTTSESEACNGSGERGEINGPSALGLLVQAADFTRRLAPVEISDQFDFGPFVCGVGGYSSSDSAFWLYKVDHVAPEIGADQFVLNRSHDEVLWYFVNTETGSNTGNELAITARRRIVRAGRPAEVVVTEYDANGEATPAEGVEIMGAAEPTTTDADGAATLVFDEAAEPTIRGVRGSDIPTDAIHFCVWEDSRSECRRFVVGWLVGTDRGDRLRGGPGRERIVGRRGPDRIVSRGDRAADIVRCGRGRDVVRADRRDRVARNCEIVRRR